MATPREIRRLAFQALYQLDARGDEDIDVVRADIEQTLEEEFSESDRVKAFDLALAAYQDRKQADAVITELAPGWPAHRQPAVDRAILRLAHYEMTSGAAQPKIAVNEAIEIAKKYSTERSPAFVNGVLDKVLKDVLARSASDASNQSAEQAPAEKE